MVDADMVGTDHEPPTIAQKIMWVLWPAFLAATAASGVFFSLFDPQEFWLLGEHLEISRLGAYSIGFLGFWLTGIASSALSVLLAAGAGRR